MLYLNPQTTFASVAMAMALPKEDTYRMVADYRAVNDRVEKVPWPHPRLEEVQGFFEGTTCWTTIDLLQGYWQMPLHEGAQEAFTMVTQGGLYTPTWVPQGVQNATGHFQATMEHEVLDGMIGEECLVWVDDIVIRGRTPDELLLNVVKVLQQLIKKGLYEAAHECTFFSTFITWCEKVFSADGVLHKLERIENLLAMRRLETEGELMQFLQATDCMYTSLPKTKEVVAPLRDLLEKVLGGEKRTKRVAKNKPISEEHWTHERQESCDAALDLLRGAVKLAYPNRGWKVLMFSDASDLF